VADLLLISPPVGNLGQAASAVSVLTAFLRSRGWDAQQWDLSIDAFHHFHSPSYLARCRDIALQRGVDARFDTAAQRAVGEIESAKNLLRQRDIAEKVDSMHWAFEVLQDAGVLLTAASLGRYELDFRHFDIPGAMRDFDSLAVALIDPEANPFIEFFEAQVLPRLLRDPPASIGISVSYVSQLIASFTLARMIRKYLPRTRIVLGGSYLTATAPDVMRIPSALLPADAVILHDGEEALDLWLNAAIRGRTRPEDVPNICLPSNGTFEKVSNRPPHLTDFAALPVPMWTAQGLDLNSYVVPKYAVPLPLTRGCHWGRCVYCNISSQQSGQYRVRDVTQALADMRAIISETGSNWFDFPVDSFHPDDLLALARAILSGDLQVEWAAEVLLDARFTESVVKELSRSGCRCLRFGLESACASTLKTMRKATRPEPAASVLDACKAHGIRTGVMLIAGFPTETQTELLQTYDFLVDHHHQVDFIGIHPFSLVPGSPMARDPASFGLYLRPGAPVLTTSLPFTNTNPVGMQNEDLVSVIETMKQGLREYYPDLGKLWTAAIGGWMTFPACCVPRRF
jgi:hypothetical protein